MLEYSMPVELFIALKHLRTRWKQTLVSILSVAVGVMILTTALSLTNGFETDMVDKILGTTPHVSLQGGRDELITHYDKIMAQLQRHAEIVHVVPLLKQQALVQSPMHTTGTLVYGVDAKQATPVLGKYLTRGQLPHPGQGIVIGSELAKKLQLFMGDNVNLITLKGSHPFKVAGFFHSGLYDLDARVVLIALQTTQAIYQTGPTINEISIKLKDVFTAPTVARNLRQHFPEYFIKTWMDSNRSLLNAMALEKKVIFLVVLFIVVVAVIGIANTLVMLVMEKTYDIVILRAVGASKKQIGRIFLWQGLWIGLAGITLGSVAGVSASLYLTLFPVRIPGDVYDLDYLPVQMLTTDFTLVAVSTFVICLLASFIPARRAVRLEPLETLRRNI